MAPNKSSHVSSERSENMLETTNHPSLSNFLQMCLKIDRSRSRVTMFAKKRTGDWSLQMPTRSFYIGKKILGYNSTINSIKCTLPPTEPHLLGKKLPSNCNRFLNRSISSTPPCSKDKPGEKNTFHHFLLQQTLHQWLGDPKWCYLLI